MNTQPKSRPLILTYLFVAFILPIPLAFGLTALSQNSIIPSISTSEIAMYINMVAYIFLPIFSLIYYRKKLSSDMKTAGNLIKWIIPLIMAVYGASAIGALFVHFFDHSTTTTNQTFIENLQKLNVYFTTYMAVIAAPITEESVFRCAIIKNYRGFLGFLMLLLSSALFSLAHSADFAIGAFLTYFFIALILGIIYLKNRNLVLNILVHAGYNALALALSTFLPN